MLDDARTEIRVMKTGMAVAALAGCLALSGCNAERAPGTDSLAATETLTPDGWRAIRIGMTLEELNAALGRQLTVAGNSEYEGTNCTFLNIATEAGQPSVMFADGKVVRLSVFAPGTEAAGGLSVGDPASKVREVFGDDVVSGPHQYEPAPAEYLTLWTKSPVADGDSNARGIRFEASGDGVITAMHAGTPAIEQMDGCT